MNCSDENIIEHINKFSQRGEYQAVKCLAKCKPQTSSVLFKMSLHEGDERNSFFYQAMAEFFIQVRQGRFVLAGKAKICTYLTEIAKRKWLNFSRKSQKVDVDYQEIDTGESSSSSASEQIHLALKQLSASDQDILIAFYFYGHSLKDFALRKKISYNAAKRRISRARERLKLIIKPVGK